MNSRQAHWEHIYGTKQLNEVSWYQSTPQPSLKYIEKFDLPMSARIIDIGGGDSLLVDNLLSLGYTKISVLDISSKAIERAKTRLGKKADEVTWIVSDITSFVPELKYDLWHDRAALHFLTSELEINKYKQSIENSIADNGKVIIGTFSEEGPTKCSGIEIKQYSKTDLSQFLSPSFSKLACENINHNTPFNTSQNFTFCQFQKIK